MTLFSQMTLHCTVLIGGHDGGLKHLQNHLKQLFYFYSIAAREKEIVVLHLMALTLKTVSHSTRLTYTHLTFYLWLTPCP